MIIKSGENPCRITKETVEDLTISNYKVTDTRPSFYAGMCIKAAVDDGKDFTYNLCFWSIRMFSPASLYED